jgi:hypothetical protein
MSDNKYWTIPMVDYNRNKHEITVQSTSLFKAVLAVLQNLYTTPILYGMEFTEQEKAVIYHSKHLKDMREESLSLVLKTMNQAYWQMSPEKSRRLHLERQISHGKISKHWYNNDFRCGGCETIIPKKQSHLWSLGGHFCNYHCFGNKLIKDRAKSDGH